MSPPGLQSAATPLTPWPCAAQLQFWAGSWQPVKIVVDELGSEEAKPPSPEAPQPEAEVEWSGGAVEAALRLSFYRHQSSAASADGPPPPLTST